MNGFVAAQLGLDAATGCRILDIGCGFGATIQYLLRNYPNLKMMGAGKDERQIRTASTSCRAEFVVANFEEIPLPAASFEAAYGLESFCFAKGQSKQAVLKEAARLLRPEGRLVVVDGFLKSGKRLGLPIRFLYVKSLRAWGMDSLPVLPEFLQTLEKQGFTSIEVRDLTWRMAPSLLHIPRVSLRLWLAYLRSKKPELLLYSKALLLTLLLSPFKMYFGYYLVTCRKSAV